MHSLASCDIGIGRITYLIQRLLMLHSTEDRSSFHPCMFESPLVPHFYWHRTARGCILVEPRDHIFIRFSFSLNAIKERLTQSSQTKLQLSDLRQELPICCRYPV